MPPTERNSAFPNTGSKVAYPKIDALKRDPLAASLIDKLVSAGPTPAGGTPAANRGVDLPNDSLLRKVADITATNVNDAASQFQLLPDTELAMQIMVSSILSPQDMMNTELTYSSDMEVQDAELSNALLSVLRSYFDNVYKIKPLLTPILEESLFLIGAYPLLVLPENVIDAAINSSENVSIESFRTEFDPRTNQLYHLGILGNPTEAKESTGISLESLSHHRNPLEYNPQVTASLEDFNNQFDFKPQGNLKQETITKFKERFSLESMSLSVTDNPHILKMPLVEQAFRAERVQKAYSKHQISIESRRKVTKEKDKISINDLQRGLYRYRRYKNVPVLPIMPIVDPQRPSIGHPLVMKLPSEAIIPVHVPSNPDQHLGYFVVLDINGNPLSRSSQTDYYTDLTANLNANQEMVSQLLATTKRGEFGRETNREMDQDDILRVYSDLVERDLMNRLRNGAYGGSVEITRPAEVMRVMLSRALAKMHTQLLYIPAEFMTYIAFDYNKYGVGMSLLQKNKIVGGLRAMMLFANTMASIKNSVQRMVINITLDPNDPQPTNTVEFLLHEVAKTRQASYPLGASNPLDLVSFLQNAGTEVVVSGNTRYPETKMELESKASTYAKPDTELEDSLRKRYLMGLGLSPETVDAGANAQFATTIVQDNLLLAKRVMNYQEKLMHFVVEFMQKYTINSSVLMDELCKVVEANKSKIPKEYVQNVDAQGNPLPDNDEDATPAMRYLSMFLRTLKVSLPAPDMVKQKNQKEAWDAYLLFLDSALDAYLDPEALDQEALGEYAAEIPAIRKTIRSYFMRQYLRVNGILSELDDIVTMEDNNAPKVDILKIQEGHMEGLMASIGEYAKKLLEWRQKHPMPTEQPAPGDDLSGDQGGQLDEAGNPIPGTDDTGTGDDGGGALDGFDADGNPVTPPDDGSETPTGDETPPDDATSDETPPDETTSDETPPDETTPPEPGAEDEATANADESAVKADETEQTATEETPTPPDNDETGANDDSTADNPPEEEETPTPPEDETPPNTDEEEAAANPEKEADDTAKPDDETAPVNTRKFVKANKKKPEDGDEEEEEEEEP